MTITIKENFDIKVLTHNIRRTITLPFRAFKELIFDIYLLSDKTKNVTYVTSRDIIPYFIERICDKDVTITKIKSICARKLRNFVNQQDAVIIDTHKSFIHFFDGGFLVPSCIRQVLDIDRPIDDVIELDIRELKKVNRYSYEVSKDPDALTFFYEKMFPYIKKKYGVAENFIYLKKSFRNGELIFAKLNGERVSASLCIIDGDGYHLHKNGVLNENFVKEGALLATYYFSILRAKEMGAKIFDFGLSRPFLSDGVLRHKNRWY